MRAVKKKYRFCCTPRDSTSRSWYYQRGSRFGKSPEEPRLHGTGFVIANWFLHSCQTPYAVGERLSILRVNTKRGDLLVLSAYAPKLGADPDVKDLFYNQLEDTVGKASPSNCIILLGAMNAKLGTDCMS
ncbi:hypothetical protein EB796_000812 [Bugula neritina]|uniref:Craniofacial development protein 2 n=1 Tax=Bugula neritina TaxID=10212 RepID=A0A7J7KRQ7_BUGNE|nr:hypothetical protein EB796_000812 [Bugula neritina]